MSQFRCSSCDRPLRAEDPELDLCRDCRADLDAGYAANLAAARARLLALFAARRRNLENL